jgi:hypothetical protein
MIQSSVMMAAAMVWAGGGIRGQVEGLTVDLRGPGSLPFSENLFPGGTGQNTLGLSTGNDGAETDTERRRDLLIAC